MWSAISAHERPARNALTVGLSCANPTRKPVAGAARSSARPALSSIERSTVGHVLNPRFFANAALLHFGFNFGGRGCSLSLRRLGESHTVKYQHSNQEDGKVLHCNFLFDLLLFLPSDLRPPRSLRSSDPGQSCRRDAAFRSD
jgi:hypothetical protein